MSNPPTLTRLAEEYAQNLTKDRSVFDGNDERIAIVAHKAGARAVLTHEAVKDAINALDRAIEVMQFAYMGANQQPKEIAHALNARAALLKLMGEAK